MNEPKRLWAVVSLALCLCVTIAGCSANNAETDASSGAGNVVARIGEDTITLDELDAQIRKTNPQAYQQIFDARQAVLDQMIRERLLTAEAESRGISPVQLQQDLASGVPAVTDAEIAGFYKQSKARMGDRTGEQMSAQIRAFLVRSKQEQAMTNLLNDLRQKNGVKVLMDAPRMDVKVAANDPAQGGPEGAPILLVEFSDFQ